MKILIDINHPAHVHLFKYLAWELIEKGHNILFTTRNKDVAIDLLNKYNFNYTSFGNHFKSLRGKMWGFVKFDLKMLQASLKFKPDLILTMGGMYASHIAFLLRIPHIALDDTEQAKEHHMMYVPFTKVCLNPSFFSKDFGYKQIRYNGFHELAYLHPNYFKPDAKILRELKLNAGERYVVVRFVSWDASHDLGHSGMTLELKKLIVNELSKHARVIISSEDELPIEFKDYQYKLAPDKMLDVLAFASLFVGEGSTMASESACLGTPAIYVNSQQVDLCTELEKYGLVYNFKDSHGVIEKALELIQNKSIKEDVGTNKNQLLRDKIDVTGFLIWFVENYPKSVQIMKENPEFQDKFKS